MGIETRKIRMDESIESTRVLGKYREWPGASRNGGEERNRKRARERERDRVPARVSLNAKFP